MPQIKYHGATLGQSDIKKYFPINPTYPDFEYFLFHYVKDTSGHYHFKVYAVKRDGEIIDTVPVTKDSPTVPINFTTWVPTDIHIAVTDQLNNLQIPVGQVIKEIKIIPKKDSVYNSVSYDVKIKIGSTLNVINKELKPSPPASKADNVW